MKIAVYNLRAGGKAGNRVHWNRILETYDPEIFLAQETRHPSEYLSSTFYAANESRIHWSAAPGRKWGSAILARSGRLKPIALPEFCGHIVGAEITGSHWSQQTKRPFRVFSIHVPAPYKRPMNAILDFLGTLDGKCDLIVGGDFNLATGIRHDSEPLPTDPPFLLKRMRRELNLLSCWQAVHPNRNLAQTLRWTGKPEMPYHCDGIFVPATWYRFLDACEVVTDPAWHSLSDHNPVVATFDELAPVPFLRSRESKVANR